MKIAILVAAAMAAGVAAPAMAAPQPPMNSFNNAYYVCDNNEAFLIWYDSNKPATATMTTSPDSVHYMLKKAAAPTGVQFAGDKAKFWTDGKTVTVEGTDVPFVNCKLKPG